MSRLSRLKYLFFTLVGGVFLWNTYKGHSLQDLMEAWEKLSLPWLALAGAAHVGTHFLRGWRWKVLMETYAGEVSQRSAFMAEMSGFFGNQAGFRLGEWTRCQVIRDLTGVPVSRAAGGVILERVTDLFLFGGVAGASLVVAWQQKREVAWELLVSFPDKRKGLVCLFAALALAASTSWLFRSRPENRFVVSLKQWVWQTWESICQMRRLMDYRKGSQVVGLTLLVWATHFVVEYACFFAVAGPGGKLPLTDALLVFLLLNMHSASPMPGGGVGVYHASMTKLLMMLAWPKKTIDLYVIVTHAVQLLNALVVGGGCFLLASLSSYRQKQPAKPGE